VNQERIRGTADIEMTPEGVLQVKQAGEILKRVGGVDMIFHSNLSRTITTARIISQALGGVKTVNLGNQLDPWHLGRFEGMPVDEVNGPMKQYIDHPDEVVPGRGIRGDIGESFNEFKERLLGTVDGIMGRYTGYRVGVVGNYRTLALVSGWVASGMPGDFSIVKSFMFQSGIETGEVMFIDEKTHQTQVLKGDKTKKSDPGVFMVRHGETPWNAPNQEKSHSGS
jgi:broad specificity phosphatase PhoE